MYLTAGLPQRWHSVIVAFDLAGVFLWRAAWLSLPPQLLSVIGSLIFAYRRYAAGIVFHQSPWQNLCLDPGGTSLNKTGFLCAEAVCNHNTPSAHTKCKLSKALYAV